MTHQNLKKLLLALCTIWHFQSAMAQTLWIESGFKNYRTCNQHLMYQTEDTLYWFNTGFEAASNIVLYKNDYFLRNDSIFQKPLSREVLYTLSNDPDTLPDSLKGPFFLGLRQADSLMLKTKSRTKYPRVMKKASSVNLSKAKKKQLHALMNEFVFETDVNALTGRKGTEMKAIQYLDLTKVKSDPDDPYYSSNGIYFISDVCFLLIPAAERKFFQVIDVDKKSILVESVCGKRRQLRIEKIASKK